MKTKQVKAAIKGILLTTGIIIMISVSYGQPRIKIKLEGNNDLTFSVKKARIVTHTNSAMMVLSQQLETKVWELPKPMQQQTRSTTLLVSQEQLGRNVDEPEGGFVDITFSQNNDEKKIIIKPEGGTQELRVGDYSIQANITKETIQGTGENPVYIIEMNAVKG